MGVPFATLQTSSSPAAPESACRSDEALFARPVRVESRLSTSERRATVAHIRLDHSSVAPRGRIMGGGELAALGQTEWHGRPRRQHRRPVHAPPLLLTSERHCLQVSGRRLNYGTEKKLETYYDAQAVTGVILAVGYIPSATRPATATRSRCSVCAYPRYSSVHLVFRSCVEAWSGSHLNRPPEPSIPRPVV